MALSVEEVVSALNELVTEAQALASAEPAFVAKLVAVVSAVEAVLPSSTLKGLETGLKSDATKVEAAFNNLFKKKS